MDSSFLYHGFGIKKQQITKTTYEKGDVIFHIQTKEKYLCCSECGSKEVIRQGYVERLFRTVPIGLKPVYLRAKIQRLECKACGVLRQEQITYSDEKKTTLII